jgi:hypothetical protein
VKKLLSVLLFTLVAGVVVAAVTADVKLAEEGNKLWCHARLHGIASGQTVKITFRWTAPTKWAVNSEYTPERALGDDETKALCFCEDTGEKGCARSRAYRTIEYENEDHKNVRAVGTWKCEILDGQGKVLGSENYEVK